MSVIQAQSIESANEHFFLNMERHTVPDSSEMQYMNNLCSRLTAVAVWLLLCCAAMTFILVLLS